MPNAALQQRLLFVVSRAPHSDSLGQDWLDAAMTGALLNQLVSILFIGEGVLQLSEPAAAAKIQTLLELSPINLLAAKDDMQQRQVEPGNFVTAVQTLDANQVAAQFDAHDRVLSF